MTLIGTHSIKVHEYNLLLIRMCLFDWMLTQKASGNYSPSKRMCRAVSSTVNHTALSKWLTVVRHESVRHRSALSWWNYERGRVSPWPTSKNSRTFLLQWLRKLGRNVPYHDLLARSEELWSIVLQHARRCHRTGLNSETEHFTGHTHIRKQGKPMILACVAYVL